MPGGILKYELLNASEKKEVVDFIDFLICKKKEPVKPLGDYRKKILSVSTWSEDDVVIFKE